MPILSSADAKTYLGITGAQDDAWLTLVLPVLDAKLEGLCSRKFTGTAQVTELYDGGVRELVLQKVPVVSLDELRDAFDTDTDPLGEVVDSTLYTFDAETGTLWLREEEPLALSTLGEGVGNPPVWGRGQRRWRVKYTQGYAAVPADVKGAALKVIASWWRNRTAVKSESAGGQSVTFHDSIPPEVLDELSRYMGTGIG